MTRSAPTLSVFPIFGLLWLAAAPAARAQVECSACDPANLVGCEIQIGARDYQTGSRELNSILRITDVDDQGEPIWGALHATFFDQPFWIWAPLAGLAAGPGTEEGEQDACLYRPPPGEPSIRLSGETFWNDLGRLQLDGLELDPWGPTGLRLAHHTGDEPKSFMEIPRGAFDPGAGGGTILIPLDGSSFGTQTSVTTFDWYFESTAVIPVGPFRLNDAAQYPCEPLNQSGCQAAADSCFWNDGLCLVEDYNANTSGCWQSDAASCAADPGCGWRPGTCQVMTGMPVSLYLDDSTSFTAHPDFDGDGTVDDEAFALAGPSWRGMALVSRYALGASDGVPIRLSGWQGRAGARFLPFQHHTEQVDGHWMPRHRLTLCGGRAHFATGLTRTQGPFAANLSSPTFRFSCGGDPLRTLVEAELGDGQGGGGGTVAWGDSVRQVESIEARLAASGWLDSLHLALTAPLPVSVGNHTLAFRELLALPDDDKHFDWGNIGVVARDMTWAAAAPVAGTQLTNLAASLTGAVALGNDESEWRCAELQEVRADPTKPLVIAGTGLGIRPDPDRPFSGWDLHLDLSASRACDHRWGEAPATDFRGLIINGGEVVHLSGALPVIGTLERLEVDFDQNVTRMIFSGDDEEAIAFPGGDIAAGEGTLTITVDAAGRLTGTGALLAKAGANPGSIAVVDGALVFTPDDFAGVTLPFGFFELETTGAILLSGDGEAGFGPRPRGFELLVPEVLREVIPAFPARLSLPDGAVASAGGRAPVLDCIDASDSGSWDAGATAFPLGGIQLLPANEGERLPLRVHLGSDGECAGQRADGLFVGPGRWALVGADGQLEVIGTFSPLRLSVTAGVDEAVAVVAGALRAAGAFDALGHAFRDPDEGVIEVGAPAGVLTLSGEIRLKRDADIGAGHAEILASLAGEGDSVAFTLDARATDLRRGVPVDYVRFVYDAAGPSVEGTVRWPSRPTLLAADAPDLGPLLDGTFRVEAEGVIVPCQTRILPAATELRLPSLSLGGPAATFGAGAAAPEGPTLTVGLGAAGCTNAAGIPVAGLLLEGAAYTPANHTAAGEEAAQRFAATARARVDTAQAGAPWSVDMLSVGGEELRLVGRQWRARSGALHLEETNGAWVASGALAGVLQIPDRVGPGAEPQDASLSPSVTGLRLAPAAGEDPLRFDQPGLEIRAEAARLQRPHFALEGARIALVDDALLHLPLTSDRRRHEQLPLTRDALDAGCVQLDEAAADRVAAGPFSLMDPEAGGTLAAYLTTPHQGRCALASPAARPAPGSYGVWLPEARLAVPDAAGEAWPFADAAGAWSLSAEGTLLGEFHSASGARPLPVVLLGEELQLESGSGVARLEAGGWRFDDAGLYRGTWGDQDILLPFSLIASRGFFVGASAELQSEADGFTVTGFQLAFDHSGIRLVEGSLLLPSPILDAFSFLGALFFDELAVTELTLSIGCLDVTSSLLGGTYALGPLSLGFGPGSGRMFLLARGEACTFDGGAISWPAFDVNTIRVDGADVGFRAQPGAPFARLGALDISLPDGGDFSVAGTIPVPAAGRFSWPFFGEPIGFSVPGDGLTLGWNEGLVFGGSLAARIPWSYGGGGGGVSDLELTLDFDEVGGWPRLRLGTGEPLRVSAGPFRLHIGEIRLPGSGISLHEVRFELPGLLRKLFGGAVGAIDDTLALVLDELQLGIGKLAAAPELDLDLSEGGTQDCPTFLVEGQSSMGAFEVRGALEFLLDLSTSRRCPNAGFRYDYLPEGDATADAARGLFARETPRYVRFAGTDTFDGHLAGVHVGFSPEHEGQLLGRVEVAAGLPLTFRTDADDAAGPGGRTTLQIETGHFDLVAADDVRFSGSGLSGTGQLELLEQRGNPDGNYFFEDAQLGVGTDAPRIELFVERMWGGLARATPEPFELLSGDTLLRVEEFGLDLSPQRNLAQGPVPADAGWRGLVLRKVQGELPLPGAGHTHSLLFGTEPQNPADAQSGTRGLAIPWERPHEVSGHLYFAGKRPLDLSDAVTAVGDEIGLGGTRVKMRVTSGWIALAQGSVSDGRLRAAFRILNRWVETDNLRVSDEGIYVELHPQEAADACAFADPDEGASPEAAGFGFTLPGGIGVAVEAGPIIVDLHTRLNPPGMAPGYRYFGTRLGQVAACLPASRFSRTDDGAPVRLIAEEFEVGSTGVSGLFRYREGGALSGHTCEELAAGAGDGEVLPISMSLGSFDVGLVGFAARVDGGRLVGVEAAGRATVEPWIESLPFRMGYGAAKDRFDFGFCFAEGQARNTSLGDVVSLYLDSVTLEAGGGRAALRFDGGIGFGGEELDVARGRPILTFQDFALFSDGTVDLPQWGTGDGWIALEEHTSGLLAGFPLALERTRLVSVRRAEWSRTGYQLDLGMRLQLGDLLQTQTGNLGATLGFVFLPPRAGRGWDFGITVEGLEVQMGYPDWIDFSGDVSYRDAMFSGSMDLSLAGMPFDAHAGVQVFSRYRDRPCAGWRVHGMISRLRPAIPIAPTPVVLTGFGGGISYHMVPPGLENIPDQVPDFFSDAWVPACRQGVGIQAMTSFSVSGVPEDLLSGRVGASLLLSPTRFDLFGQVAFLADNVIDGIDLPAGLEEGSSVLAANQGLDATLCAEAFIGLDISAGALDGRATLGCGPRPAIHVGKPGWRLLSMQGHAAMHLSSRKFFLEVGNRDRKVQAKALPDWLNVGIDSYYYLGSDAWEAGAGASAGFGTWDIWICEIGAKGSVEGDAGLAYRRQLKLQAGVAGRLNIDACIASVGVDANLRLYLPRDPHFLTGNFRVRKRMPWFLPDINFGLDFTAP